MTTVKTTLLILLLAGCLGAADDTPAEISPLQFHIGSATLTPVGFVDFTTVFRTTNPGTGIGTNFGSIPYNNSTAGSLSEVRFSSQNSRVGIRVDAVVKGANVLGYLETDFLGAAPSNASVSSNSAALRLRVFWASVRKKKWELLAGQSWSLLTPNRKGLSPLPSDLFYSQVVDVNYQNGLVWSRDPQFRLVYHPSDTVALGVSLENPDQYIGGSGGGGLITLPAAFSANNYSGELNNGTTTYSVPNLHPDIIGKIAFDPKLPNGHALHFEVAGVYRTFRLYNPLTKVTYRSAAGGGSLNVNYEVVKNVRLVSNNFVSDGGGRWIFGQAPDLVVRANGSPSPVHAASTVSGIEAQAGNTQLYAYYGGVYVKRNVALDVNLTPVGYGYAGSPNSQNRSIQELTFGMTRTFWKDAKYGALQVMGQYSYVMRGPWAVAAGAPSSAHSNMVFFNLRYTLPGSAPTVKY
jgi:hypothetical protein